MTYKIYKSTGISLVIGSLLIIVTMILHPAGGDIEHLIRISQNLKVSHVIGMLSVPVALFGFYGLTRALLDEYHVSVLAFIIISLGLLAALLAALLNGIILPSYLSKYAGQIHDNREILNYFVTYNFSLNSAFDYIFIVACCLSIAIYSWRLTKSQVLPKWLGYFGLLILSLYTIGIVLDFAFTSLIGFRFFTFSLSGWVLLTGIALFKTKQPL